MRREAVVVVLALGACDTSLAEINAIYSRPGDGPIVCGLSIDNKNTVSTDAIGIGLDKASVEEMVIHLYSHKPAGTVDEATIEEVVAAAADRDLPFVTYRQLQEATVDDVLYGLALSFDDHDIAGWYPLLPLFERYGAKVTFFISELHGIGEDELAKLHEIEAAGHAIEYHGAIHDDAALYVEEHGIEGYYHDEILADLPLMRAAGFDPKVFAYPFGSRTDETDAVVAREFSLARGSYFRCPR